MCFVFLFSVVSMPSHASSSDQSSPVRYGEVSPAQTSVHIPSGKGKFNLLDWGGPKISVYTYVPTGMDESQLPILIVMHGTNRDADRYRDDWAEIAQEKGIVIVAPTFSKNKFPKAAGYNLGGVFKKEDQKTGNKVYRDESKWAFSAIEPIFDTIVAAIGSSQTEYTIYGHSAGSQFVHRFLFYKPNARVKRYLPANAGWYTRADMSEAYPYGLLNANVSEAALKAALQKDVIIMLGDEDNDAMHKHLRRTPEAMRQGPHRYARGLTFFKNAEKQAKRLGVPFGWKVGIVSGATHSNAQMAVGAAGLVE